MGQWKYWITSDRNHMALALIFLAGIACLANRHPILGALCIVVSLMGVISAG
jgi:hypothetical protein